MSTNPSTPDVQILHSWKEISSYTGRGVRTLQRYEANLGFPIHRPLGKPRSSVLAFKHEIDQWLEKTPVAAIAVEDVLSTKTTSSEEDLRGASGPLASLCQSTEAWREKTHSMQQGFVSMQQAVVSMQKRMNSVLLNLERTRNLALRSKLLWTQTELRRQRRRARVTQPEAAVSASASAN